MGAESETNAPFGAAPVANDGDGQTNKYISGLLPTRFRVQLR
jgi:hypothetical protein